ncbi:MAG TPA: NUDIX hydrolase [Bacilli bacterium]
MTSQNSWEEKTVKTEVVFTGKMIDLAIEHVTLPNGKPATREVVRHPGAVAVLAVHDGKMLVVEQYRKALGRTQVEIPAGKLEPGEEPIRAARRELEEETGYRCKSLVPVHSFYTAPGFSDEIIHLYWAEDLQKGEANPDEDEFLTVSAITPAEAEMLIRDSRISDAKTLLAYYIWRQYIKTGVMGL